jgi:hypothetical protein
MMMARARPFAPRARLAMSRNPESSIATPTRATAPNRAWRRVGNRGVIAPPIRPARRRASGTSSKKANRKKVGMDGRRPCSAPWGFTYPTMWLSIRPRAMAPAKVRGRLFSFPTTAAA